MGATHELFNQARLLADLNLFEGNRALQDALKFNAPGLDAAPLSRLGQLAGSAQMQRHARLAKLHGPGLRTHDLFSHRIDEVEFHPSHHVLTSSACAAGGVRRVLRVALARQPRHVRQARQRHRLRRHHRTRAAGLNPQEGFA